MRIRVVSPYSFLFSPSLFFCSITFVPFGYIWVSELWVMITADMGIGSIIMLSFSIVSGRYSVSPRHYLAGVNYFRFQSI